MRASLPKEGGERAAGHMILGVSGPSLQPVNSFWKKCGEGVDGRWHPAAGGMQVKEKTCEIQPLLDL